VIIPAFQAEATLGSALASIAAQTMPADEVVIADDGSTDETTAIARAWESMLPVRVLSTGSNGGPAAARHRAIQGSSADLLALLDADDVWFPDHLDAMHTAYTTTVDGLASADPLPWIPGQAVSSRSFSRRAPLPPASEQLAWLLTENRLSTSTLFSRARYAEVGGFRPQFPVAEDWDLWIRMVRAGAVVVRPDHPTLLYRLSRSGASSDGRMTEAQRAVLEAAAAEGGPAERAATRVGLRHNASARSLLDAYELAAEGKSVRARLAGARATRGVRSVALRGLAMSVAPGWVARRREKVRYDPEVWLRRYDA
jgi:hypothetical protein